MDKKKKYVIIFLFYVLSVLLVNLAVWQGMIPQSTSWGLGNIFATLIIIALLVVKFSKTNKKE